MLVKLMYCNKIIKPNLIKKKYVESYYIISTKYTVSTLFFPIRILVINVLINMYLYIVYDYYCARIMDY